MSKKDIIEAIAKDKKTLEYCKKVCKRGDLYNDLMQYTLLYLLEMDENKLIDIHNNGRLDFYVARIIYINANSPSSRFMNTHKTIGDDFLIDNIPIVKDKNNNRLINRINKEIAIEQATIINSGAYPVSVKLLELYAECGNLRDVSRKTGIPYMTVYRHVTEIKTKLKNKIKHD